MKTHKIVLSVLVFVIISLLQSIATAVELHPWDVNQDGVVDKADLDIISNNFGSKNASADVNSDGIVNILDLVLVSKHFGEKYDNIIGKDGAPMVLIPAGEFQMGDSFNEGLEDERPVHTVYLEAFYMDVYEVTNAQYKKFVQATRHREPEGTDYSTISLVRVKPWQTRGFDGDNQPVVCVSWEDAKAYADWAGKRLPTEAEWEKAARGGLKGKRFVWGDDWSPPKNSGNFADETAKKTFPGSTIINGYDDGYAYAAPVGKFTPNGYGLYDMAGNVCELCADWYDSNYYSISPKSNPKGPDLVSYHKVLRGGSWGHYALRVAYRSDSPEVYDLIVGFRCVQ
jgi:formylglycine-generating enzyme required for sulfatase activity